MSKRPKRWPLWKIGAATVGCALVSCALFWLSGLTDRTIDDQSADPVRSNSMLTLSSFVMMLAMAGAMLSVLGVVWLVLRIRDARIPAWKKQGKKRRY